MRIVRYAPRLNSNFNAFDRVFENIFQDLLEGSHQEKSSSKTQSRTPLVDVFEDEKEVHLRFEVPGVSKEDLKLELKNGELSLQAENSSEGSGLRYNRVISLPDTVNSAESKADLINGVLLVSFAKKEESKLRSITVN